MIALLKALLEKADGQKTNASIVLLIAWVALYLKVPGAKEAIGADNFQLVLLALLGAAGVAMRQALEKLPEKTADAHEERQASPAAAPAPSDTKKDGAP